MPTVGPPARDPNALAAETGFFVLPKAVYASAVRTVLEPLTGTAFDSGRLRSLMAAAPQDDLSDVGYVEPVPPGGSTVRMYLDVAEQLTGSLEKSMKAPCAGASAASELTCIDDWVASSGRRAWRRPVEAQEVAAMRTLYTTVRDAHGKSTALGAVIHALLTSPHFVFAVEGRLGGTGDVAPLDGFEIVTRLARTLWSAAPDDPLLEAAGRGELKDAAGVEAVARRMLSDKRMRDGLVTFASQWLRFTGSELEEARSEAGLLLESVVLSGDGRLATVLTTRSVSMNSSLAVRYGLPRPQAPNHEVFLSGQQLPPERMGLLTMSGVLRGNGSPTASPIKRGKMIRERMLCQTVPDPPAEVPPLDTKAAASPTLRARLERHRADAACSGCHALIDPIGFALENFDAEAKYRTTDKGAPIDSRGELRGTDVDGVVEGAAALVERLARSRMVKECVATQAFRYLLGRREDVADGVELARVKDSFVKSDGNLRELLVAIARGDAFRSRRVRQVSR